MARRERPPDGAPVALEPGTLVIGDLHLDVFAPGGTERFVRWLERRPDPLPRLVILGDLFEYWVGRGQGREPGARAVLAALAARGERGTAVDVLPGNRDFLLGEEFTRESGARLHPGGLVGRHPDGSATLFLHGDELCTTDRAYRAFRRVVRSRPVAWLASSLPLGSRRAIARALRARSARSTARKAPATVAVQPDAALARARGAGARTLICGHAHRFRDERLDPGQGPGAGAVRWLVIDAWGGARDCLVLAHDGWRAEGSRAGD